MGMIYLSTGLHYLLHYLGNFDDFNEHVAFHFSYFVNMCWQPACRKKVITEGSVRGDRGVSDALWTSLYYCYHTTINKKIILLTVWSGSLLTWLLNRRWDNSKQGKSKSYPPPTRCSFGKLYSGKWLFLSCFLCLLLLQIIITFNVFDH